MSLRSLVAALGLAFIGLSCGSDAGTHYRFDADTTEREQRIGVAAMNAWNEHTLPDSQMRVRPDGEYLVTFADSIDDGGWEVDGRECTITGESCRLAKWVRIHRGRDDARTLAICKHELGHSIGLEHVGANYIDANGSPVVWGDQNSVMTSGPLAETFSIADLTECRRAGACGSIVVRSAQ